MTLALRLFSSPDTTLRTGGIIYTIQAILEDIPLNTSLSFLQKIDMLMLNDSEGLIQFDGRDSMTGGLTFALLRPEMCIRDRSRGNDLLFTDFRFDSFALNRAENGFHPALGSGMPLFSSLQCQGKSKTRSFHRS